MHHFTAYRTNEGKLMVQPYELLFSDIETSNRYDNVIDIELENVKQYLEPIRLLEGNVFSNNTKIVSIILIILEIYM